MKMKTMTCLLAALFLVACGNKNENTTTTTPEPTTTTSTTVQEQPAAPKSETKTYYAWVDKLRIRDKPSLDGKEVVQVAEGTALTFNGEISSNKEKITLRGQKMDAPFYKVSTPDGKSGWVYAGALSKSPVDVQSYRVAIAFEVPMKSQGDYGDNFDMYIDNVAEVLMGSGIQLMRVRDHFHEVSIKNSKGEIIGVESIAGFAKGEGTMGIVCIEKGKNPILVNFSTDDMGPEVLKAFGMN